MNRFHALAFSLIGTACDSIFATDFDEAAGVTLFAFDSVAIPFSQNLRLEMRSPTRHPANPVLQRGQPGTPDAFGVRGFHTPISWSGQTAIAGLPDRIRLKVSFEGEQKTKIHFSALYVQPIVPAK